MSRRRDLEISRVHEVVRIVAASPAPVQVRHYLIVANKTIVSPGLQEAVNERCRRGPAEFHVLVPRRRQSVYAADPMTGLVIEPIAGDQKLLDDLEREDAIRQLQAFMDALERLGSSVTGEIGVAGDPVAAVNRVMERSSFDEIILSTLAPGVSKWFKLDLPNRLRRASSLPIEVVEED